MVLEYAITFALAVVLLCVYFFASGKRERLLLLLFDSVAVVNFGHLLLSLARSLPFAIIANDIAYFGSVWLSVFMFLIILGLCGFCVTRRCVLICCGCAALMFAIVATSGLLPWYHRAGCQCHSRHCGYRTAPRTVSKPHLYKHPCPPARCFLQRIFARLCKINLNQTRPMRHAASAFSVSNKKRHFAVAFVTKISKHKVFVSAHNISRSERATAFLKKAWKRCAKIAQRAVPRRQRQRIRAPEYRCEVRLSARCCASRRCADKGERKWLTSRLSRHLSSSRCRQQTRSV